jgi:hypothetical protein
MAVSLNVTGLALMLPYAKNEQEATERTEGSDYSEGDKGRVVPRAKGTDTFSAGSAALWRRKAGEWWAAMRKSSEVPG